MHIEKRENFIVTRPLQDITSGNTFLHSGSLFIKTSKQEGENRLCVRLHTGDTYKFDRKLFVEPVKTKVIFSE